MAVEWFNDFKENPTEALEHLLFGCGDVGMLAPAEPDDLLLDWLGSGMEAYGYEEGEFAAQVDDALSEWVDMNWGQEKPNYPANLLYLVWKRIMVVLANYWLPKTNKTLLLKLGRKVFRTGKLPWEG